MPSIRKLSLFATALAGSAAAHNNGHGHLHRKRQATQIADGQVQAPTPLASMNSYCGTVTATKTIWVQPTPPAETCPAEVVTKYVTVCGPAPSSSAPYSTLESSTSSYVESITSSSSAPSSSPYSTSSYSSASVSSSVPVYVPSSTAPAYTPPPPAYTPPAPAYTPTTAAHTAPASTPSSSYGGGSAPLATNGNKWAMTYTPYNPDGTCRAAGDVASDIASIAGKGFKSIRIYATDCSGVENVGNAAKANGMNMILGIYIDSTGLGAAPQEQLSTVLGWGNAGNWDHVEMIVVGNEAIFNNWVSAPALAGFIAQVKTEAKAAGFTGLITTTEPIEIIEANGHVLCPVVDIIAANIHPFFNPNTPAVDAGTFVANSLNTLSAVCNHSLDAYNLETGWPTAGHNNGLAVPGMENQVTAVDAILATSGDHSVIFSFANDPWKSPGPLDVEQYWGAGHLFAN